MLTKPVLAALAAALLSWAVLLVISRALILHFHFDPWAFALIQMAAGGCFMMWVGRGSSRVRDTLMSPLTWLYGVLRVGTAACFTAALVHTTTANAAFLGIVSVPLAALVTGAVLGRRATRLELVGHAVVLLGLLLLVARLPGGIANPAVLLMFLSEVFVVGATLVAEFHPVNKGENERSRAFLSGVVLAASAVALMMFLALAEVALPLLVAPAGTRGLADPVLWVVAVLIGVVLRGPSIHLSLRAIQFAGTTTYIAAMASLPLAALVFELSFAAFDLLAAAPFDPTALLFGTLCVVGSLVVLLARTPIRASG